MRALLFAVALVFSCSAFAVVHLQPVWLRALAELYYWHGFGAPAVLVAEWWASSGQHPWVTLATSISLMPSLLYFAKSLAMPWLSSKILSYKNYRRWQNTPFDDDLLVLSVSLQYAGLGPQESAPRRQRAAAIVNGSQEGSDTKVSLHYDSVANLRLSALFGPPALADMKAERARPPGSGGVMNFRRNNLKILLPIENELLAPFRAGKVMALAGLPTVTSVLAFSVVQLDKAARFASSAASPPPPRDIVSSSSEASSDGGAGSSPRQQPEGGRRASSSAGAGAGAGAGGSQTQQQGQSGGHSFGDKLRVILATEETLLTILQAQRRDSSIRSASSSAAVSRQSSDGSSSGFSTPTVPATATAPPERTTPSALPEPTRSEPASSEPPAAARSGGDELGSGGGSPQHCLITLPLVLSGVSPGREMSEFEKRLWSALNEMAACYDKQQHRKQVKRYTITVPSGWVGGAAAAAAQPLGTQPG